MEPSLRGQRVARIPRNHQVQPPACQWQVLQCVDQMVFTLGVIFDVRGGMRNAVQTNRQHWKLGRMSSGLATNCFCGHWAKHLASQSPGFPTCEEDIALDHLEIPF